MGHQGSLSLPEHYLDSSRLGEWVKYSNVKTEVMEFLCHV